MAKRDAATSCLLSVTDKVCSRPQGHRKSDTQVPHDVKEKLEMMALAPHSSSHDLGQPSKSPQGDSTPRQQGNSTPVSTPTQGPKDDEEKVLEALREVVRKCTNPDTSKRPTAANIYEMLLKVYM